MGHVICAGFVARPFINMLMPARVLRPVPCPIVCAVSDIRAIGIYNDCYESDLTLQSISYHNNPTYRLHFFYELFFLLVI